MKRFFSIIITLSLTFSLFAQKDVTTFLGIPVDGYKSEMREKLIAKGFTPKRVSGQECFEGEFNGTDVRLYIAMNKDKVYRIMVSDVSVQNETDIRIRFNNLVRQFKRNARYYDSDTDYTIQEDEDISYQMTVKSKRYEAVFYQKADNEYIKYVISNDPLLAGLDTFNIEDHKKVELAETLDRIRCILYKQVWFMIAEYYGKYYIVMYYDNAYNKADGEDL